MTRFLAILRGINVGGHKKILMADLRNLFSELKFENVSSYIQSGNVGFDSNFEKDSNLLAPKIEAAILKKYGYEVPVIVKTRKDLLKAISLNPYLKQNFEIEKLYLTFLKEIPTKDNIEILNTYNFSPDGFKIIGQLIFGYCHGNFRESKLSGTFFENKLKVKATTRNWKTILKLVEL